MIKYILIVVIALVTLVAGVPTTYAADPPTDRPFFDCATESYKTYFQENDIFIYNPCAETCSVSSGSVTTLRGADNREKIFNYLKDKGLTNEQAAGVTGNIQHEGGYSPTRQEESKAFPAGGWGIVQWTFGRRSNPDPEKGVVAYIGSKAPELISQYYKDEFGGAVSESKGFVPEGIPAEANDQLLIHELDFLFKESNQRTIRSATVPHVENVSAGDTEWEALKKQTTVEKASNLWVWNFEIPANIPTTAIARAAGGNVILGMYTSGTSSATTTNSPCGDISGSVREKIVQVAEQEYAAWQSGAKKPGGDYLEYTYGTAGEWCAWFVSWVYKGAGYPVNDKSEPYYSYVKELTALGRKNEKFEWHANDGTYTPRPGDMAIYGSEEDQYHTNIVISAQGPSSITTIGGNEGYGNGVTGKENSLVKKTENSTGWAEQALGYVSPKG